MRAVAYARVSTKEQEDSGASLSAQHDAIQREIDRREWERVLLYSDTCSGSTPWEDRRGLSMAIEYIELGHADVLVCAKLDRLSRSMLDLASLLERARKKRWQIVLLDFGLDTSTPVGEMVAHILGAVATFERRRIGERTKEALAAKKAQGVRLGRPSTVAPTVIASILHLRSTGWTWQQIADELNALNVPTPQGGKRWRDTSVRAVYKANARVIDAQLAILTGEGEFEERVTG